MVFPKTSVVIPTIGRNTVRLAVESVLAQGANVEVIVVVDRPDQTDSVRQMLGDLDCIVVEGAGLGAGVARNVGVDLATGDYIGFLDDDDTWISGKIATQIQAMERGRRPSLSIAVGQTQLISKTGRMSRNRPIRYEPERESLANFLVKRTRLLYGNTYFSGCSLLGPATLIKALAWDPSLPRHQDWDLFIRMDEEWNVEFLHVDQAVVSVHQGSIRSISASRSWEQSAIFLKKHDTSVSGRARSDFVVLNMLAPALQSGDRVGVAYSWKRLAGFPHLGALVRALIAVVAHR